VFESGDHLAVGIEEASPKSELERALLGLEGVRSVTITEGPVPHVAALYVEPRLGQTPRGIIEGVVAAARERAGVEIGSDRVHVISRPSAKLAAVVRTARPRQWVKNLLVFGAPATGGVLLEPSALLSATLAFAAFCLASSGMYFINDVFDRREDQEHPIKRYRPIASNVLSPAVGIAIGATSVVASVFVGFVGGGLPLVGIIVAYAALVLTYTLVLRKIALLDLAAIAGGFLLRAVAGGVATAVPLSEWFLIVASFGSLFLAAGKRQAEYIQLGRGRQNHRASLAQYSESYLRYIQYTSSTIAIAAYTLWAFEGAAGRTIWSALSVIPFVLGIFRYGLLLEAGRWGTRSGCCWWPSA
jgi:decaprenyl-phosphate phosphoribosyltransferase